MTRAAALLAVAVFLGGLLLPGGCGSLLERAAWESWPEPYRVDFHVLWEMVKLTLMERYDTVAEERAGAGYLRTGWRLHLNYLAGLGYRERAEVRVQPEGGGYRVFFRVVRETNEEPVHTTDPHAARWRYAGEDRAAARHLVGLLHVKLRALKEDL